MTVNSQNSAEAQMLIRKGVVDVYNAFIDPEITKHFWFTHGSDKLEIGKEVTWTWEMYNFSSKVISTELDQNKKIKFDWFAGEHSNVVEITFKTLNPNAVFVSVVHSGFHQTGADLVDTLKDSTSGFTIVLAGLKAYLEHGINLNLIGDKFPKELTTH